MGPNTYFQYGLLKRASLLAALTVLISVLSACNPAAQKRPFGYIKLGKVRELLGQETIIERGGLILRRDAKGFFIMSTYCTKDLSHLAVTKGEGGATLSCPYDHSSFDGEGKVLTGPAISDLPYYKLEYSPDTYGGPVDSLYVKVGEEVAKDWRLELPGAPAPE